MSTWARLMPRIAVRTLVVTALWLVIDEGDLGSLVVGIPLSVLAAAISVRLYPEPMPRIRAVGTARFAAYFLGQSIVGGVDVALRALRPSMPIDPACVVYRLRLPLRAPRILFVNTVSLLPGTLSSELKGDELVVHALDGSLPVESDLERLELRVAGIFGIGLEGRGRA